MSNKNARKPPSIPTEADFARAKAAMRERDRGLSTVSRNVLTRFRELCPNCYGFYVLWQGDPDFRAYFFTEGRAAVDEFAASKHLEPGQAMVQGHARERVPFRIMPPEGQHSLP